MLKKIPLDAVALFALLWLMTGMTINLNDQRAFTLQQMGVDAIVSHGTYTLGHSSHPLLTPRGDTFYSDKGILPAKQPGQFSLSAAPYFLLKLVGITYEQDYDLSASLVTLLSTSLMAAIALTLLYQLMIMWKFSRKIAFWSVLATGVLSHWLVFSAITHHDIMATSLLIYALFCAEKNKLNHNNNSIILGVLSGTFAGMIVFTSMLPALMVVAYGLYIFSSLNWRSIVSNGLGFALGLLPLALYNWHYFGHPWVQANVAGNYADTFFQFSWAQFTHHLNAYFGNGGISIWKYAPLLTLGIFGIAFIPAHLRRVQVFIGLAFILHMSYLLNIETLGTCMYGPRYLLPLLPLFSVGLAALASYMMQRFSHYRTELTLLFGALAGYSLLINMTGALGGAMQCDLNNFTYFNYANAKHRFSMEFYPFFWPALIAMLILLTVWFILRHKNNKAQQASTII